ncbi:MAG: bifunctional DNA-formamidopyrimidine glycosylase/DNA-(apurinic or apyrimidinic site) lyase [Candidatus Pacebacteria bacterium]|nr:bifunctional DNA-formamidopyrimidine glycosylase/DNA-(apurinic or apyrimidinic site) lyase [Candidatus Paceibacterota bacterium]
MPELPEVQTTVRILNKKIKNLSILDVWTDYNSKFYKGKDNIKNPKYFETFKKEILNKKFLSVERKAKNVLLNVSGGKTILVHMKMTGKLLYGKYEFKDLSSVTSTMKIGGKWFPIDDIYLSDPFNRFIHLVFSLSNGKHLVLSDARKFAKIIIFNTKEINNLKDLKNLGPEPLEKSFTFEIFKERLMVKPNGKIKTVLMNQEIISGIGNIYSDEALWYSCIHPMSKVRDIKENKLKKLFINVKKVLELSISVGGDSMSDYRNPLGKKGGYQDLHKVYRKTGMKCVFHGCNGIIRRIIIGGRSAHYCDKHQS